jgi:hypothetical protein
MPAARTASPASCPPISRASSGTVDEAVAACTAECGFTGGSGAVPLLGELELGDTVGNSPPRLLGDVEVLGIGGSEPVGSVAPGIVALTLGGRTTR